MVFVYFLENKRDLNKAIIYDHVAYLRMLDESGKLLLSGPFMDYPGGMVVIETENIEQAIAIAEKDPFVSQGYRSYEIRTLDRATKENHYGL